MSEEKEVQTTFTLDEEETKEELTLEERGANASKEIAEVLKRWRVALAVNIEGAQEFIESLKPTLVDQKQVEDND